MDKKIYIFVYILFLLIVPVVFAEKIILQDDFEADNNGQWDVYSCARIAVPHTGTFSMKLNAQPQTCLAGYNKNYTTNISTVQFWISSSNGQLYHQNCFSGDCEADPGNYAVNTILNSLYNMRHFNGAIWNIWNGSNTKNEWVFVNYTYNMNSGNVSIYMYNSTVPNYYYSYYGDFVSYSLKNITRHTFGVSVNGEIVYIDDLKICDGLCDDTAPIINAHSITLLSANNTINNSNSINFHFNNSLSNLNVTNFSIWTNNSFWHANITNTTSLIINGSNVMTLNLPDGVYLWNVELYTTNGSFFANNNYTLIIDTIIPVVKTNYINNSYFFKNNITLQINFSDEHLWSINITLDNICLFNITNLSTTVYNYNLSYDTSSLSGGWHYINATAWDGHTSATIDVNHFNPDIGFIFKNSLTYSMRPTRNTVKLYLKDGSLFDKWSYNVKKDRVEEIVEPNNKLAKQIITVESDIPMYVYTDKSGQYGGQWLIIGDKWKDFVIDDEPTAKVDSITFSKDRKTAEVTISGLKNHLDRIKFSSTGDLNVVHVVYGLWVADFTWMQNSTHTLVGTGDTTTFGLFMNMSNFTIPHDLISAKLRLNNTLYTPSKYVLENITYFLYNKYWDNTWGNATGINYTWNWWFNITNSSSIIANYNTSLNNITVFQLGFDNCSGYGHVILNYTLYDETTKTQNLVNGTIEVDLSVTAGNLTWYYNTSRPETNLSICVPESFANTSTTYILSAVSRYYAYSHTTEFHYLDNVGMTSNGTQNVNLYTLNTDTTLSEYSTSFLLNYLNRYYSPEVGAIADLLRYYIPDGSYISVENGKFDSSGNTVLHLVAEDVKYKLYIRKDGQIIYTSEEFSGLCQTTPCKINLIELNSYSDIGNYSKFDNLEYSLSLNRQTRTVTAVFATDDGSNSNFNLNVVKYDAYNNVTICDSSLLSSGGSLSCVIPVTAANASYLATFEKDSEVVRQAMVDLKQNSVDTLGYTSIIMTVLMFLTLVFMAASSGSIAVISFGLIGLVLAGLINIFTFGNMIGMGSTFIWLLIAGGIIIAKASKRGYG